MKRGDWEGGAYLPGTVDSLHFFPNISQQPSFMMDDLVFILMNTTWRKTQFVLLPSGFFFYFIGWMRFKDSSTFPALVDCLYILCILFILIFFCFEIVDGSLSSYILLLVCEDGYSCPNLAADPEPNLFFLASGSSQLYISWIICCRSQH